MYNLVGVAYIYHQVTVAALISYVASFEETFDVAIVKDIPPGYEVWNMIIISLSFRLPNFTPPKSTYMLIILQDAAVISIVTFSVAISLAQVFAKEFKYTVSPNQACACVGVSVHVWVCLCGCVGVCVCGYVCVLTLLSCRSLWLMVQ